MARSSPPAAAPRAAAGADRLDALRDEMGHRASGPPGGDAGDGRDRRGSVFAAVDGFRADFGALDRVMINAGMGKGAPLGTGRSRANRGPR